MNTKGVGKVSGASAKVQMWETSFGWRVAASGDGWREYEVQRCKCGFAACKGAKVTDRTQGETGNQRGRTQKGQHRETG